MCLCQSNSINLGFRRGAIQVGTFGVPQRAIFPNFVPQNRTSVPQLLFEMVSFTISSQDELARAEAELKTVGLKLDKTESAIEDLEEKIDATTDTAEKEQLQKRLDRLVQKEIATEQYRLHLLQEKSRLSLLLSSHLTPHSTQPHTPAAVAPTSSSGSDTNAPPATVFTASVTPQIDDKDCKPVASVALIADWICREPRSA